MTSFEFILLQGSLFFGLYVCLHRLFFKKSKAFLWNRIVLLILPLASFVIPFAIEHFSSYSISVLNIKQNLMTQMNSQYVGGEGVELKTSFEEVGGYVWLAGALLFFFKLIYDCVRLLRSFPTDDIEKKERFILHWSVDGENAWTFLKHIVIPKKYKKIEQSMIYLHEKTHAEQWHSLDNIWAGVWQAIFWWNPFVYLWKKDIQTNHEFIADDKVIEKFTPEKYGELLLNITFNTKKIKIANMFLLKSNLKNRLIMLKKNQKFGKSFVIVTASLILVSFTLVSSQQNTISKVDAAPIALFKVYDFVDQMPEFPGGSKAMYQFLAQNIHYPEEAVKSEKQGKVYVAFIVSKSGKIKKVEVKRGVENANLLNQEAVRVIKSMPRWTPGRTKDGKKVNVRIIIPIHFTLSQHSKD